jgi:putative flavoprotein involved in K+ transport
LDVPVLDHKGRVRHDGGVVTDAPGMYLLGVNLLRRRRSSFIHGAGPDTDELAAHLHAHLAHRGSVCVTASMARASAQRTAG